MRGVLLYLLLVFSLVSLTYASPYPHVTGNSLLDAKAVGVTGLSLLVDAINPNVTIIAPDSSVKNGNTSIILLAQFFDDIQVSSAFFNLDNGTNVTLTLNSSNGTSYEFNTSISNHRLYVFVRDGVGHENSSSVYFPTDFNLTYTKYLVKFNGSSTTNLTDFTNLSLSNISNLTFETPSKGKINFIQNVNLTNLITANIDIMLFNFINISQNLVFLNSTILKELNKTVNISLYNLTFTTPRVLRDGEVCSSNICTSSSYVNHSLTFTVTGFSTYSAEETPAEQIEIGIYSESPYKGEGIIKHPVKPTRQEENPVPTTDEFGTPSKQSSFIQKIIRKFTGKEEAVSIKDKGTKPLIEYPTEIIIPIRNLLSAVMTMAVILLLFLTYYVIRNKIVSKN